MKTGFSKGKWQTWANSLDKEHKGLVKGYREALQLHGAGQAGEKGVSYAQGVASTEQIIHSQFRCFCTESADDWLCGYSQYLQLDCL